MMNHDTQTLISLVRGWGRDNNILAQVNKPAQGTVKGQLKKLDEEVQEVKDAIAENDQEGIKDGIGDATVVLILLADLCDLDFESCLDHAYQQIKDRKGQMINGTFVKASEDA